jgi:hypothetical protein
MKVAIGLPNAAPATTGTELTEWARHYYAWLGDEVAGDIAGSAATDREAVQGYLSAYEEAGCDGLILFPSASDAAQVDLLADAADL